MRKFLKNQKGVTMIEVLVTVGILAIVVVPCLSSFVMAQRGNALAGQTRAAYTQAANLMEQLKGMPGDEQLKGMPGDSMFLERVKDELRNEYQDGKSNKNDGVHAICVVKQDYLEIWIYSGEEANQIIAQDGEALPPEGYILKGVIAQ